MLGEMASRSRRGAVMKIPRPEAVWHFPNQKEVSTGGTGKPR